jgi:hypothetical protein
VLRFFALEKFKEFTVDDPRQKRYAISNYGRLISFTERMEEGKLCKGSIAGGYRFFRYKVRIDDKIKNKHFFISKLVAINFLPKISEEHVHVLHIDRNRLNDFVDNLKWATKEEMLAFQKDNPIKKAAWARVKEELKYKRTGKLTIPQVMFIKKELQNPDRKTKLTIIARKFGITTMQLHRIKTGKNWGHIKV